MQHTRLKWSATRRDIDKTYETFVKLGVPTVHHSRIAEYRRLCHDYAEAGHNPAKLGLEKTTRLLHAVVEVDQLVLIATAAAARPEIWQGNLERLVAGPAFPLEAVREAKARDYQYECLLAAAAQIGGFEVQLCEPDVIVRDEGLTVGVAAKRPRIAATLSKNCRKAVKQVKRYGRFGIVAIDVSSALFHDYCVNTNSPAGALPPITQKLTAFVNAQANQIRDSCAGAPVLGVLITACVPALVYAADDAPHDVSPVTPYTAKVWSVVEIEGASVEHREWFRSFVRSSHAASFRANEMAG